MPPPRPITIVHLSDLQFGRNHRFGRLSRLAPDDSLDSLCSRLKEDLDELREKEHLVPDLLAVTGDLAEWGRKPEFDDVLTFLDRLAGLLGLTRDRVLVVPGNHDINRKLCLAYFAECEGLEEEPREPFWPKLRHYAGFFQEYYQGFPELLFTEEQPWTLYEFPALKVVVAGLNSTWKESHRETDHYGWLGEKQLRWFAEKLRRYKEQGWLRIGLVHHNIQRRPTGDEENLRDSDDLKRILGNELNLVLHGHTHEGRLEWLTQACPILSTGSASVTLEARPQEVPNQYQVLRIHPDKLWYCTRQYAPDKKSWIADPRGSRDGNQWFDEQPLRFEHVDETFGTRSTEEAARKGHSAALVENYRAHVVRAYKRQPLQDLSLRAEDQDIPGGLPLLEIFIPQAVSLAPPTKDLPLRAEPEDDWGSTPADDDPDTDSLGGSSPPLPIEEVLLDPKRPWIVLLGAPGAGKTSLTRWLCLKLCAPGESLPNLPSGLLPVRVEMRRFDERYRANTAQGRSFDFFDYLDQEHAEKATALRGEPLRELGRSGRLWWLFDGLDEVSDRNARRWYAEMIVGLRGDGEHSRGLITSRIVGAGPVLPCFQAAEVPVCTLLDFDEPRIQQFITRWHDQAFPAHSAEKAQRRKRLEEAIARSRAVRDLCKNPLLLTLIALINRGGDLPRRRHTLYRRAVELMAAGWDANKQLPASLEFAWELDDTLEFFRELAWWMVFESDEAPSTLIEEGALLEFTSAFLQAHHGRTPEQSRRYAASLLGHLRERSYILARVGESRFGFVHKTFLEYFAADALRSLFAGSRVDLQWLGNLFSHLWTDESWHEVLTLVCGMLEEDEPENVMRILQAILPLVENFQPRNLDFGGFAVRCLAEVRQLDREPLRTFLLRLSDLARHELLQARFLQSFEGFTDPFPLIGPRWPDRQGWQQWQQATQSLKAVVRMLAHWLVFDSTPPEEHAEILGRCLRAEWSTFVAHYVLARVNIPEEQLRLLLTKGDEGTRCILAGGLLYPSSKARLYEGRLTAEARATLDALLAGSQLPMIRVRAAVILAEHEPTPRVRETLLACTRNPTARGTLIAYCLRALGAFVGDDPQLAEEVRTWPIRLGDPSMLQAAADALTRAERWTEAARCFLEWVKQLPGHKNRKRAEEKLLTLCSRSPEVLALLEEVQAEWTSETLRALASSVLEETTTRRQLKELEQVPLSGIMDLLEAPTASHPMRQKILRRVITRGAFADAGSEELLENARFLEVLRELEAPDAPPMSRLEAAITRFDLSSDRDALRTTCRDILLTGTDDERARLMAARWLGDEGRLALEGLAAHAVDEEVRDRAATALESLRLRTLLQAVGHRI
jgi:3',5'-cyclic AMP phosphodiesterase CpdA